MGKWRMNRRSKIILGTLGSIVVGGLTGVGTVACANGNGLEAYNINHIHYQQATEVAQGYFQQHTGYTITGLSSDNLVQELMETYPSLKITNPDAQLIASHFTAKAGAETGILTLEIENYVLPEGAIQANIAQGDANLGLQITIQGVPIFLPVPPPPAQQAVTISTNQIGLDVTLATLANYSLTKWTNLLRQLEIIPCTFQVLNSPTVSKTQIVAVAQGMCTNGVVESIQVTVVGAQDATTMKNVALQGSGATIFGEGTPISLYQLDQRSENTILADIQTAFPNSFPFLKAGQSLTSSLVNQFQLQTIYPLYSAEDGQAVTVIVSFNYQTSFHYEITVEGVENG